MYAVIETGGKQYRVKQGDVIDVERLASTDSKAGKVVFDRVLMVGGEESAKIGTPTVSGAEVTAELVEEVRSPKVRVFKKKRRKGYKRLQGHRQDLVRVRIENITA